MLIQQPRDTASKLHKDTFKILVDLFPFSKIQHEYSIKINGYTLFIDIFMEKPFRLAVECHGEQHFSYVGHFHSSRADLLRQQRFDVMKAQWCEENGIPLVVVKYSDKLSHEFLLNLIDQAIKKEGRGHG